MVGFWKRGFYIDENRRSYRVPMTIFVHGALICCRSMDRI
jgi:hypothetical protein